MNLPRLTCVVLAATLLAGCGSSSSSDSSAPATTTPPPSVTLSGFVTDRPIQDATVTATVNGQTFTAAQPTGSDGAYEIEISSDSPDALVRLEAVDAGGATRLSAIVDAFDAIQEAVADTTSDETFNITNVTTAQEVLATRLTEDGTIDSKEELLDTVARVETRDLLEVSAAIKLVVDGIDGVTLPDGVADTHALAEAIVSGESSFIDDVEVSAPGALDSAVNEVLTDGNATLAFTTEDVPGVYVTQDGFSMFAFLADGTGFAQPSGEGSAALLVWQVDAAGVLTLSVRGSAPRTEQVTLLDRNNDIVNVVVREAGADGSGSPGTARLFRFDGQFTETNVPGSYSTINAPGELTVFTEDGNGYDLNIATGATVGEFTWAVDEQGTLILTDADGSTSQARRIAGSSDDELLLLVTEQDASGALVDMALIDVLRSDAELGSNEANALLLAGSTYAMTEVDEIGLFAFGIDGVFTEIIQQQDQDGTWSAVEGQGTWSVDAQGVISILFAGESGDQGATVLAGLGEDVMTVQSDDNPNDVLQVTRVVPLTAADIVGGFVIQDEITGAVAETVVFRDDYTGTHTEADGTADDFLWQVSGAGNLVVQTESETGFDSETLSLHMLAGSGGDLFRFVAVSRINGLLEVADPASAEMPDVLMALTLIRSN